MTSCRAVLAVALLAVSSGCMTLRDDRLPRRAYSEVQPKRGPVAVDYDLAIKFNGNPSQQTGHTQYHDGLEKVAAQAGCFSSFHEGRNAPWHIHFEFDDAANDHGTSILCGLTLFVFPLILDEEYTLTATVEHEGKPVRSYVYKDGITTYTEWLLFPLTPFFPLWRIAEEVNTNMVLTFLCDLMRDDIISQEGPRAPAPPPSTPQPEPAPSPRPSPAPEPDNVPSAPAPAPSAEDR